MLLCSHSVLGLLDKRNNARKEEDRDKITAASALGFSSYAQEEDLVELQEYAKTSGVSALFRGTLEPGNLLYIPAGMVSGEQITGDGDHIGFKIPVMFAGKRGDVLGLKRLRSLQMEAKDQNKKNQQLDDLIQMVDSKNSELLEKEKQANEEKKEVE